MNRKDYMENRVTFEEYYRSVNKAAGLSLTDSPLLPEVRAALEVGDVHLTTIELGRWDAMAFLFESALSRAFKKHEDFFSLGNAVCCLKQAARDAVGYQGTGFGAD